MDDEKLKKKIWQKFGTELKDLGITDLEFERRDSFPEETELAKKSCYLKYLGKAGKYLVFVVCCIYGAIKVFTTLAALPDDYERFKVNYPDQYQIVQLIGEKFKKKEIPIQDKKMVEYILQQELESKYIAFDPNWILNKASYDKDVEKLEQDRKILEGDRPITLFPASSTSVDISNSSSLATAYNFRTHRSDDFDKKA
jgi:hypothetical protein